MYMYLRGGSIPFHNGGRFSSNTTFFLEISKLPTKWQSHEFIYLYTQKFRVRPPWLWCLRATFYIYIFLFIIKSSAYAIFHNIYGLHLKEQTQILGQNWNWLKIYSHNCTEIYSWFIQRRVCTIASHFFPQKTVFFVLEIIRNISVVIYDTDIS
jgi:hypothetical protein